MNVDAILQHLNSENVDCILIGGMNFLLRHVPELTFDVDVWVRDDRDNLARLNRSLLKLGAAWGPTEKDWKPVPQDAVWLLSQPVFCLTTNHGALDVFRDVLGLQGRYAECKARATLSETAGGAAFWGLSDGDMLTCQLALPEEHRRSRRIEILRAALNLKTAVDPRGDVQRPG